jgi:hypothetical protein
VAVMASASGSPMPPTSFFRMESDSSALSTISSVSTSASTPTPMADRLARLEHLLGVMGQTRDRPPRTEAQTASYLSRLCCFNCGEMGHPLRSCTAPLNRAVVDANRRRFNEERANRPGARLSGSFEPVTHTATTPAVTSPTSVAASMPARRPEN